jgi:mannose-1-phosphate guanylyltransferase
MDRPVVACILAGGIGSRLYPASRPDRPKPFLELGGDRSLLARTLERARFADERYVLTTEAHASAVHEHAPDAGVLIEPERKETGPALVYAAWRLRDRFDVEPALVALPSDHHVADEAAFATTCERAAELALETGGLVTLGVEPTRIETGYGYVVPEDGNARGDGDHSSVARFVEKPNRDRAADLVASGAYWNAGVVASTPSALLEAARSSPLAPLTAALADDDPERGFDAVDPASVDDAILERAESMTVVPFAGEWTDLGNWDAVGRVLGRQLDETATASPSPRTDGTLTEPDLSIDASNNVAVAPGAHVSLLGVEDLIVAAFDDQILVAPRADAERVREVVTRLRDETD